MADMGNRPIMSMRFELEGLRATVLQYIGDYQGKVYSEIERMLRETVENFDFEAFARPLIEQEVRRAVRSYFESGRGHRYINDVVDGAMLKHFGLEE